jgi:hypothetical protein
VVDVGVAAVVVQDVQGVVEIVLGDVKITVE